MVTEEYTYMDDKIAKKLFTNERTGKKYAAAIIGEILKVNEK